MSGRWSDVCDVYIPDNVENPQVRLRKRGDRFYLTKKYPIRTHDLSEMREDTLESPRWNTPSLLIVWERNDWKKRGTLRFGRT